MKLIKQIAIIINLSLALAIRNLYNSNDYNRTSIISFVSGKYYFSIFIDNYVF